MIVTNQHALTGKINLYNIVKMNNSELVVNKHVQEINTSGRPTDAQKSYTYITFKVPCKIPFRDRLYMSTEVILYHYKTTLTS